MKSKKIFRSIAAATAALVLFSALAGCGRTSEQTSEGDRKSTEEAKLGYPVSDTPIKLKYWVPLNALASQFIRSYDENEAYQEIQKRTGIDLEFIHPAQGQERELLQLMVASGDLPDIIRGGGKYSGGEFKGLEDGVFADLTTLIPQYAPDYYKYITENPEVKREVTNDDGKMVGFYRIMLEKDSPARRVMLREDWLKEFNLEIPRTLEDYENYFKMVKEKKNIASYVLNFDGVEEQFVGAFGIWAGLTPNPGAIQKLGFFTRDGETVSYGKIQPEFKEYLELMSRWYKAGYISRDFAGMKKTQQQNLFDTGKAGMYVDPVVATFNRAKKLNNSVTSAPYPRIKQEDVLHWDDTGVWPVVKDLADVEVISGTSKHQAEAVRFLNYGFTQEGAMLFNFGVEGKSYVMENGKPKFTDYILKNPKFGTDPANYILKMHLGTTIGVKDEIANPNLVLSPESAAIRKLWSDDKNVDYKLRLPPFELNSEELSKRTNIMTQVETYADEMILKFIIGVEPLDKYDNYVNQIKKMGIDEAIKYTQAAYDRYRSKK